jgi:hypothetical protein
VAWYRLRVTFARRWRQSLALAVLIGLIGGVGLGSLAAARRTQSSYPAYLAQTNASDLTLSTYGIGNAAATVYSAKTEAAIARLPAVRHVESWVGVIAVPLTNGAPAGFFDSTNSVNFAASETGLYFNQDRPTVLQGRLADPGRVDEFMTTALGAQLLGLRLDSVVPIGLYTPTQFAQPGFGTARVPPAKRFEMKLVGIVEFNNQVVQDDTDRLPTNVIYTPAFARQVPDDATNGTWYGIQLRPGAGSIATVEEALLHVLPPGASGNFSVTAVTEAKVERAVKPETIALGVFGLIALLAALGIALLVINREVQTAEVDRAVLRALGAPPLVTLADAILGVLFAVVLGSALAGVFAVALSPLTPLGPIHTVFHPGLDVDWTVVGFGFVVLVGVLGTGAVLIGLRRAPQRLARRSLQGAPRASRLAHGAAGAGLPLPAVIGIRFALEPGTGRTSVPARSVLLGAVVAVLTATATLTFGSSLHDLATHPSLYGWNWDATLSSESGVPPAALSALSRDPKVAAWSGYADPDLQIDGQTVPALVANTSPTVGPPILSGQTVTSYGPSGVELGPATLALLHKRVGDAVTISYGTPNTAPLYLPPTRVVVEGTATFPAIAGSSTFADHTSLGTGMLVTIQGLPAAFVKATKSPDAVVNGPALVFVRLRSGVSTAAGQRDMRRIIGIADAQFNHDPNAAGDSVSLLGVQRPAEIVNYQSTGSTPELLAAALAAGAALGLALALTATTRRRRRDLAMLKTMGCTRGQLATTLMWQASVTVACGVIIGLPLGIALGRQLWVLFARNIDVVPHPTVPGSVALVALGALVLALLMAIVPGRQAATTPAAVVLRNE